MSPGTPFTGRASGNHAVSPRNHTGGRFLYKSHGRPCDKNQSHKMEIHHHNLWIYIYIYIESTPLHVIPERERPTIIYWEDYTFSRQLFGTIQTSCPDARGAVPRMSAFMPKVCRTVVPNLPTIFSSESPSLTRTSCPTFSSNPSYTCPAFPYPSAQRCEARVSTT